MWLMLIHGRNPALRDVYAQWRAALVIESHMTPHMRCQ
jgi:hypothetical protein